MSALTPEQANAVWDVLVDLAGANEGERDTFVRYLSTDDRFSSQEYRFIGLLGFGGKLHYNGYSGARISCYPEDLHWVREAIIATVNERLAELVPSGRVAA